MRRLLTTVALAAVITPSVAGAATWSPKDVQRAVIAGAALTVVGLTIYNNERIHHRVDNARNAEIEDALLERRQRVAAPLGRNDVPLVATPTMAERYTCVTVDVKGVCTFLRAVP